MSNLIKRAIVNIFIAIATIITLSFSVVIGLVIYESFFKIPEEVTVPSLTGKEINEATAYLKKFKLNPVVMERFSQGVKSGDVISQSPTAGERVRSGRDIKLVASLGEEQLSMPDVRGLTLSEAVKILNKKRFVVGTVTYSDGTFERESIVEQTPAEFTRVPRGTVVKLKVNRGAVIKYEVPAWQGKSLSEAYALAADSPFKVGRIRWLYDSYTPYGTIMKQTPLPLSYSPDYRPINVDVSAGDRSNDLFISQDKIEFIVPNAEDMVEVRAILKDRRGTTLYYRADHLPGDRIELLVTSYGSGEFLIFSDNKLRQKYIL